MFQVGDYLVYGFDGVCHVDDIGHPKIFGSNHDRLYYSLTPLSGKGTIYTPVDSKVFMRPVITDSERSRLLQALPALPVCEDVPLESRSASQYYQELLRTHDCEKVMQVYKTLYMKQRALTGTHKTISATDMRYMKQAEDMLVNEFTFLTGQGSAEIIAQFKQLLEASEAE